MASQQEFSLETWMKPGRDAFEYWISFFPTAPMFGVPWRFGDMAEGFGGAFDMSSMMMPGVPAVKPNGKTASKAEAKTAPKAATKPIDSVKPMAAAKTAPKAETTVTAPAPKAAAPKAQAKAAPKAAPKAPAKKGVPAALMSEAPAAPDDLKLIKGIGPGLEKQLNGLGVYTFAQLSGFSDADLTWVDTNLTAFKGRCFRDDWVGQAKALMA